MYVALDTKDVLGPGPGIHSQQGGATHVVAASSARLTNSELAQLIQRIAHRRDREAFTRVFDHFAPRVKAFLRRRNVSTALADDVTQEAMLAPAS